MSVVSTCHAVHTRKGVMTTSKPNDSPDEPTATASAQAGSEAVEEAEGEPGTAAETAKRILTSTPSTGRSAVPSALAEPEPEPASGEAGRGKTTAESTRTEETEEKEEAEKAEEEKAEEPEEAEEAEEAGGADAGTSGEAEVSATATSADDSKAEATAESAQTASRGSSESATGDSARTAVKAAPGRPHKALLAGAAIVGALLISVPFLISGGDGDDRSSAKPGATPGTVLDGLAGAAPGVVGSESPSPHASTKKGAARPKTVITTGPDGKPVVVTVSPKPSVAGGGNKPTQGGGKGTTAQEGKPAGTSSGSGGTSSDTSSGSGSGSGSGTSKTDNQSQTTPSEPWPGGVQIYGHASNRCIGVANSPNAPTGSKLVIWDCYNESYQRWKFVDGTVRSEGKCMNVSGGTRNNGAVINWTTCNGSGAQQFRLNSAHDLTNPQSGNKCVDVIDQRTDNGARLQLWQCQGTPNQKWSTRTP
ncbi:ricin-type beta-trefoil lectin domain protein [Streptomyces sp. NPDC046988]|uniref:ricin-type beta-trefoil lectin domain protein n=1 Tax=Streptomyces sp. NPDC046988 TaxID=3154922 RepID=UPI0033F1FEE6